VPHTILSPYHNRHHVYTKKGKEVELAEVGPRFEMKREWVNEGEDIVH
jgi:rRNA maturation protein Rpf1